MKSAAVRLSEGDVHFLVVALPNSTHSLNAGDELPCAPRNAPLQQQAARRRRRLRQREHQPQHQQRGGGGSAEQLHSDGGAAVVERVEEYWKSVCTKWQLWFAVHLPKRLEKADDTNTWCRFGFDEPLNHHRNLVQ